MAEPWEFNDKDEFIAKVVTQINKCESKFGWTWSADMDTHCDYDHYVDSCYECQKAIVRKVLMAYRFLIWQDDEN